MCVRCIYRFPCLFYKMKLKITISNKHLDESIPKNYFICHTKQISGSEIFAYIIFLKKFSTIIVSAEGSEFSDTRIYALHNETVDFIVFLMSKHFYGSLLKIVFFS